MSRTACPRCGSFNEEAAVFCDQCGSPLKGAAPPRGGTRILWLGAAGLVAAAAAVMFLRAGADRPRWRASRTARRSSRGTSIRSCGCRATPAGSTPTRISSGSCSRTS